MSKEEKIVSILAYFSLFEYPLRINEINVAFGERESFDGEIESLILSGKIEKSGEFYKLAGSPDANIQKRIEDNSRAKSKSGLALKRAKFIGSLNFAARTESNERKGSGQSTRPRAG